MTLVYLTLAWLAGIALGQWLWAQGWLGCTAARWPFGIFAALAALTIPFLRRQPRLALAAAVVVALSLGVWRYSAHPLAGCPTPTDLAYYNDGQHLVSAALQPSPEPNPAPGELLPDWVTLEGRIAGYPEPRDAQIQYRLRVEMLTVGGKETRPVHGDVLVRLARTPAYTYGSRLRVSGLLQTAPVYEDFDYRTYLARQGIYSIMEQPYAVSLDGGQKPGAWSGFLALLYDLRSRGESLLDRVLPEPAAALANGMLLGIQSGIPRELYDAFNATGVSHVIVISGANIALLSGVLMAVAGRLLGKRRAAWLVAPSVVLYVLLVGAAPAAARAGVMGFLYVIAIALGRRSLPMISLFVSAAFLTLLNPLLLGDLGFQLSALSTLGLILFASRLQKPWAAFLERKVPASAIRQAIALLTDGLILTLAAQITTLPLLVYTFGRLSLISLLTNILILPAQPPIMLGGLLTLAGGLIWEPLGRLLAALPWLFLTYTTWIVRLSASVPFAVVDLGNLAHWLAPAFYALVAGILLLRKLATANYIALPSRRRTLWLAGLALPLWLVIGLFAGRPDGRLHITYLPVPGGEATLISTPAGRRLFVWDGKGDGDALARAAVLALGEIRPSVDVVIGRAGARLWPSAQMIDPLAPLPGPAMVLDRGITLTPLLAAPGPASGSAGWSVMLAYGNTRIILPSTLGAETQDGLLNPDRPLNVTVLKTAGPGTGAWPSVAFLEAAKPQLIIWPEETTYPPDVAAWLAGHHVARVPADATVEVVSDGEHLWLKQWSGSGPR
jgi:competence protein ComEC